MFMVSTDYTDLRNLWIVLSARNADFSLHKTLHFERHALSLCLPNKFGVDLEDAQFYEVFDSKIRQAFVSHLGHKLWRDLEDLHLHETLERFLIEAHLRDLANEIGIDLEDAGLDEIFHPEVEATGFHFAHESGVDLKDGRFEEVVDIEFAETGGGKVVSQCSGYVNHRCTEQTVF